MTVLYRVKGRVGFKEPVELAGDIVDQASSDLAVGLALCRSALRSLVKTILVALAVARAVEPDPDYLAA